MMVIYKIGLLCLLSSALISWRTYNYAPLPPTNPMFTEKGQMALQASMNIRHAQAQFSYSPLKNFAFNYGFSRAHSFIGLGSSHGVQLQHYGAFKKDGVLFYHVGFGLEFASLNNSRNQVHQTHGGPIPYRATSISKYYAPVFGAGIYTSLDDGQTQFGFDATFTFVRYTLIDYIRTVEDDSSRTHLWISVDNAGKIVKVPIIAAAFTIKHSGEKGLFYQKWALGYRLMESVLYLPNRIPNGLYKKEYADYNIPDLILSFHLGLNIHALKSIRKQHS